MKATDRTSGKELAPNLAVADTFFSRLKGLLGKKELPHGEGLWIKHCKSIHTFGMRFPIDVVFLDKENKVVGLAKTLGPNRIPHLYSSASSVIELPAGTIDEAHTVTGDYIEVV
ncbi:MAG: DUF192 domain-containing protein [Desulfuromonadaceae bacterium]|nr:DUF192 domain-containing protein [Desulfuromonadaceae bacterium]